MFRKDEIYIIQTSRHFFVATFAGLNETAVPFLQFVNVMLLDEGKYTHFLKTGQLIQKDFKGTYTFNGGFWIHERWIMSAIHVGVSKKPDLKSAPEPKLEATVVDFPPSDAQG